MAVTEFNPTVQVQSRISTKTVEHRTVTLQIRHLLWSAIILWLAGFIFCWSTVTTADAAEKENTVVTQPASAEGKAKAP